MTTWILTGDASRAVLYAAERRDADWRPIGAYSHAESRMKNLELTPTEPSHSWKSNGDSRQTVMESSTGPKGAEKEHFAQQLADVVNDGAKKKAYDKLVLERAPHFAGLFEQHLSSAAMKREKVVVHKDYTITEPREARQCFEEAVFGLSSR